MGAPKPRGRRPGTLARFKCWTCGVVNLVSGGSHRYRCQPCRETNFGAATVVGRHLTWGYSNGKDEARCAVALAIRDRRLAHPVGMTCADCGGRATEYEHRDYNKPLCVDPICRSCNLRRGPAIPIAGAIERMLARGYAPYVLRRNAQMLFRTLGRPTEVLDAFPSKLSVEHWWQFWPERIGADGAPATPTAEVA